MAVVHIFEINDILCIKSKAEKGILEKISIKRILLNVNPVYVDTFNSLWNESELISEVDALEIISVL